LFLKQAKGVLFLKQAKGVLFLKQANVSEKSEFPQGFKTM